MMTLLPIKSQLPAKSKGRKSSVREVLCSAVLLFFGSMTAGCNQPLAATSATEVADADELNHAHDHETPENKPLDYYGAVEKLRTLISQIRLVGNCSDAESAQSNLDEIVQQLTWLPEIAGDSDMPEADWNEVNHLTKELLARWEGLDAATFDSSAQFASADTSEILNQLDEVAKRESERLAREKYLRVTE